MPSNIPSKSDVNGAAEFIKHQNLCDLDYYSHFSREELENKHTDILRLYEVLKKDARVWISLSFTLYIFKRNETLDVLLLPRKGTNMYSFANLSKGHICPCLFPSIDAAIADLDDRQKRGLILEYDVIA